ncbi:MAG TPA: anthranilate synthase component I family protein, partial [Microbacterium sp.]|nr:anthranilate synthase component I family protein [Microbacterium sp.]
MPAPLEALPLDGAVSAEALFLQLFARAEAAFWLDAGAGAADGWSIIGTGDVESDQQAVRA